MARRGGNVPVCVKPWHGHLGRAAYLTLRRARPGWPCHANSVKDCEGTRFRPNILWWRSSADALRQGFGPLTGGRELPTSFDASWHGAGLRGDAVALADLASAALGPLYRFCYYRLGRRRELCEEVVQETLVRAIRELDRYEPDR